MLRRILPLALACAALLAACGGDDDDGGDSVSASAYAKDACTAARDWVSSLQKGSTDIRGKLNSRSSPADGKRALQGFLDDAVTATEKFGSDVEAAGVPDVEGGEDAANDLRKAADDAKGVMEDAKERADNLPTGNTEAFVREAGELGTSANKALSEVGNAIGGDRSDELQKTFRDESTCRQVGGSS